MSSKTVTKHKKEERTIVPLFFFRLCLPDEEPLQNAERHLCGGARCRKLWLLTNLPSAWVLNPCAPNGTPRTPVHTIFLYISCVLCYTTLERRCKHEKHINQICGNNCHDHKSY